MTDVRPFERSVWPDGKEDLKWAVVAGAIPAQAGEGLSDKVSTAAPWLCGHLVEAGCDSLLSCCQLPLLMDVATRYLP